MWNKKNRFKTARFDRNPSLWQYRYTVDYIDDLKLVRSIYDKFKNKIFTITTTEIIKFINRNPKLTIYQKKLKRDVGWQRAFDKDKKYKKNYYE